MKPPEYTEFRGKLAFHPDKRFSHVYVIGGSRSGKTTYLLRQAVQDIQHGNGVGFISPHADAALDLLRYIPPEREKDVVYFEPTEYPIGLEVFAARNDKEREQVVSDLLLIFKRLDPDSSGPRMRALIRCAAATFAQIPGSNLLDFYRLLINEDFKQEVISKISDEFLIDFWRRKLPEDAKDPIIQRLSPFLTNPSLKRIFTSHTDLFELFNRKPIFVVNLGLCSRDTATLVGTILISKIQSAFDRRADIPKPQRVPFYLYCDEFQRIKNSAFEELLSEAGKYKLGLIISHQYEKQLDSALMDAIEGNIGQTGTKIRIRPGYKAIVEVNERQIEFGLKNIVPPPRPAPFLPTKPTFERATPPPAAKVDLNSDVKKGPPPV